MDEAAIITQIFNNSFERDPAAEGIEAWEDALASGAVNVVSLAAAIVDSAAQAQLTHRLRLTRTKLLSTTALKWTTTARISALPRVWLQ